MTADDQHIDVLFAETGHTIGIELDRNADLDVVVDALTRAVETDDPTDAERELTSRHDLGSIESR